MASTRPCLATWRGRHPILKTCLISRGREFTAAISSYKVSDRKGMVHQKSYEKPCISVASPKPWPSKTASAGAEARRTLQTTAGACDAPPLRGRPCVAATRTKRVILTWRVAPMGLGSGRTLSTDPHPTHRLGKGVQSHPKGQDNTRVQSQSQPTRQDQSPCPIPKDRTRHLKLPYPNPTRPRPIPDPRSRHKPGA